MIPSIKKHLLFIALLLLCTHAKASHIVGGEFFYTYNGDTLISGTQYNIYTVSLNIYEDCKNGQPEAIAQDNPAILAAYRNTPPYAVVMVDSNVFYASSVIVPPVINASPCGTTSIPVCLLKKTFIKRLYLVPGPDGYVVSYQRCCRHAGIVNIDSPGDHGVTYSCRIPPAPIVNSSAAFTHNPHQIICVNMPLYYDNSATDADGDSLSYGFCAANVGANDADIKPRPLPPPYDIVSYLPGFSAAQPFSASAQVSIDPITGIMTGQPDQKGRFLVGVCCYEWRGGVIIDSVVREFEFIVTDCDESTYKPDAGADMVVMVGDSAQFHASGAVTYTWSPATFLNTTTIADPVGLFTTAGDFAYTVHGISDSGCGGIDVVKVKVLAYSMFAVPTGFTPNNDGVNDMLRPMQIKQATLTSFKIYNRNGNLVYEGNLHDQGWDGTVRGKRPEQGVYTWQILYKDNNGVQRIQTGSVTLIQ